MLAKPAPWWPGIRWDAPLSAALQALWPFWEGAGQATADVVDNRRRIIAAGTHWSATAIGASLYMPVGGNLHLTAADANRCTDLNPGGFTVTLLARTVAGWDTHYLMGTLDARADGEWLLSISDKLHRMSWGQYQSGVNKVSTWYHTPLTPVPAAPALVHLTVTSNAAGYLLGYVNSKDCGPPSAGGAGPSEIHTIPTGLGFGTYFGGNGNNAQVDTAPIMAALWARPLTSSEVFELHGDPFQLIRRPAGMITKAAADLPPAAGDMGYTAQDARLHHTAQDARLHYTPPEGVPLHYTSAKP